VLAAVGAADRISAQLLAGLQRQGAQGLLADGHPAARVQGRLAGLHRVLGTGRCLAGAARVLAVQNRVADRDLQLAHWAGQS
jgi:hypothetical protein